MAAKLEWKDRTPFSGRLVCAGWQLAMVWREGPFGLQFHYEANNEACTHGGPYERAADAFAACESEVRRLLRDAGVEADP